MNRVILHLNEGSDGILALRAARSLMRDGHQNCIYSYENGVSIYAYHTQTGVAAREDCRAAIADTHPKDGDVKQAPLVSGGGSEGNRP